jgi:hypothetical protein
MRFVLFQGESIMRLGGFLIRGLTILLTAALPFGALAGGGSDGGGNDLVAGFVARANDLLNSYNFSAADKEVLKRGLNARIISVSVLRDPRTNQPIKNQKNMVAYGSPGLIQLKEKGLRGGDSWSNVIAENRSASHTVAHELFRAAGVTNSDGVSIDDGYQRTIGDYHLDDYSQSSLTTAGLLDCDGRIRGKILVTARNQHALISDLTVDGRPIRLADVKTFDMNNSVLKIRAKGLQLTATIPSRHGIGIRNGIAIINGKKKSVSCLVPELSDLGENGGHSLSGSLRTHHAEEPTDGTRRAVR